MRQRKDDEGMKRTFIFISLLLLLAGDRSVSCANDYTVFQAAVWNPVQLFPEQYDVCGLRLNMLHGQNRDLYGVDIGLMNRATRDTSGIQLAVIVNITGAFGMTNSPRWHDDFEINKPKHLKKVCVGQVEYVAGGEWSGIQVAGLMNVVNGKGDGLQLASLGNFIYGDMKGCQVGFLNINSGRFRGVQVGAGNCVGEGWAPLSLEGTADSMDGIQVGGAFNHVSGHMRGIQLATALVGGNSAGRVRGLQISTAVFPGTMAQERKSASIGDNNYALDLNGVQIGLWFNRAEQAHGMQIGLVNYCREMTGLQLGVVNIIRESPVVFFPGINFHF